MLFLVTAFQYAMIWNETMAYHYWLQQGLSSKQGQKVHFVAPLKEGI